MKNTYAFYYFFIISFVLIIIISPNIMGQQAQLDTKHRIDEEAAVRVVEETAKNSPEEMRYQIGVSGSDAWKGGIDSYRQAAERTAAPQRMISKKPDKMSALNPGPNLTIEQPATAMLNIITLRLTIHVKVINNGDAPAGESHLCYFLSSDMNIDLSDVQLGCLTVSVLPPNSKVDTTVEIDVSAYPGSWYLIIMVDGLLRVAEDNENDNIFSLSPKFDIPLSLPKAPILESPSNGATDVSINPRFYWRDGGGAAPDGYYIGIWDEFGNPLSIVYSTDESKKVGPLSYSTIYHWYVRAENGAGSSEWSDHWTFTTEGESGSGLQSWFEQSSGVGTRLNSVDAVSPYMGWACGRNNVILSTIDGGETWADASGNINTHHFTSIDGLDEHTALVSGYHSVDNQSFIYKTVNGGDTWLPVYGPNGFINHIQMFDMLNGRALGDPVNNIWTVLETSDGGDSWSMMPNRPSAADGDRGYPFGVDWHSTEAGWFGTNTSKAYQTTDGGVNWLYQPIPEIARVTSVAFDRAGVNGLACAGGDGKIVRSSDSGASWESITSPQDGIIFYMHHADEAFWALIDNTVYSSPNHGNDWNHETEAPANLRDLSFHGTNENRTGWAVGNEGVIMRYGTETTAVEPQDENRHPTSILLFQNYPNPFNAETTIPYHVQNPGLVEIKILDVRGKDIATLVHEFQDPGAYQCTWDASDMPSGIYLYRLQAGSHIEMRKLILQK